MCISKAREENLVLTLEEGCCLSSTRGPIRHLVISSNWKRAKDVFDSMLDLWHVRSLTVYGEWRPYFISEKMRFLRVLDLEDTLRFKNHHLDEIGQLHHLRYLSIRENIWYLPNSIGNLSHLQTLDIKGTRIFELPATVTKLRKLRHLRTTGSLLGTENENGRVFYKYWKMDCMRRHSMTWFHCRCLQCQGRMCHGGPALLLSLVKLYWSTQRSELGWNMHDILNLHRSLWACLHKCVDGVKAPGGTGKLASLQTLGVVNVTRGKEKVIKELSALTQLRKLGVAGIKEGNGKRSWSAIAAHNQLRSLTVHGDDIDGCLGTVILKGEWVGVLSWEVRLGGGLFPPEHLESLKLIGRLHKVPQWMQRLQYLSKLDLKGSRLDKADEIETLGSLPNLAVLRLRGGAIVLEHLHFVGPSFPILLALELNGEPNLVTFEKRRDA
ncbi:hypothetical protein CFC21_095215 [Triticum aestivum]|uniref:Disease resistance R13L4/SHOC-2-like LRR domain-containing protein n=2 Tax=Triticum aestivum TaxID=4565 RepID=A0A9R1MXB8_WHEAT|nr:hypothetical protein CFC21_095215 [Triticum aestivum]